MRLQLGNGTFEGRRIVSPENLAVTRSARVAATDKGFYAMGWVVSLTPNGNVVWHNGGTYGFGAYIGMQLDRDVGIVILTNAQQVGFPDAVAAWAFDRLLNNPVVDHVANTLKGTSKNRPYSSNATKLPANDSASFPFRFINVHSEAVSDRQRDQFFEVPLCFKNP